MNHAARYATTQGTTASKERMMVMLFQTARRHMRTGTAALSSGNRSAATAALDRASSIVQEMLSTLSHERAPELCASLSRVYLFVLDRLLQARLRLDGQRVDEALRAFTPVVEAFEAAVAQNGVEP